MICVTHQPADIWAVATRVVLLDRGAILLDEPRPATIELFNATAHRLLAA